MKKQILDVILKDRKDKELERVVTITVELDANIIMLALYHKGPQSYSQLQKYVENPSKLYKQVAGLEDINIIKNKNRKFFLTDIGKKYLIKRGITSPNPF